MDTPGTPQAPQWPDVPVEKQAPVPPPGSFGVHTSFAIYLAGVTFLLVGLVFGAVLLDMPGRWIGVCVLVLLGLSVLAGAPHRLVLRQKR